MFSFLSEISGSLNSIIAPLKVTLSVAFLSLILGLILAMVFTVLESSKFKPLSWVMTIFISAVRSLPEILIIFMIIFGFPYLVLKITGNPPGLPDFWLVVFALSLIFASYASQTIRGALLAVSKSQWESGQALGLGKFRTFFTIILPQMWYHALPGLSNQWLVLLKDTALVSLVDLEDIMHFANNMSVAKQNYFTWYSIVALIYLTISLVSQLVQNSLYHRLSFYRQPLDLK